MKRLSDSWAVNPISRTKRLSLGGRRVAVAVVVAIEVVVAVVATVAVRRLAMRAIKVAKISDLQNPAGSLTIRAKVLLSTCPISICVEGTLERNLFHADIRPRILESRLSAILERSS
jgi:hypothetical protein